MHEEQIRLVLMCLDRHRLQRNQDTGRMERDSSVFQDAARWLAFYGEEWVKKGGKMIQLSLDKVKLT